MTRKTGYSLIEVIVAFAVMSAVLAVLIPGQAQLLGRVGTASERVLAQDYAFSILEEASVLDVSPGDPPRQFRDWDIQVSRTELGEDRIEVAVDIRAGNGAALARLSRQIVVIDVQ